MRRTEPVRLCGLAIIATICGCFGIYSIIELAESITILTILWAVGVIVFCGISIGAITLAWFGWRDPIVFN